MNKISDSDLKRLHEVQVEIVSDVDKFCKENDITYFLIAGSLLGSIRHKGFIPWDDDIDIGMMRSDYEKFIKLYPNNSKNKYYVQSLETDPKYWQSYAKVRKSNTLMIEERVKDLSVNKEIFIDVFPFDKVSDLGYEKVKIRANLIKVIRDTIYLKRHIKKLYECNFKIFATVLRIFPVKFLYFMQKKMMTYYQNKNTHHCICYIGEYKTRNEYMNIDDFLPVKKGDFENKKFNILNNPHAYLEKIYGNYMELPPVNKRITHGILKVDFLKGDLDE